MRLSHPMADRMPILQVSALRKDFPGVTALGGVSASFYAGEVHGLVGENGAGKSTLMNILAGVQTPTAGQVFLHGKAVHFRTVAEAQAAGIVMIHQELNLIDELSVADNIFLGREQSAGPFVRSGRHRTEATRLLAQLRSRLDPRTLVGRLSVAEKQLVEIAKAISCRASVLIMDEPTAVLTERETAALFDLIADLRRRQVSIIYISHLLPEVLKICDRVTVMRDGAIVRSLDHEALKSTNERELASMMVGRRLADHFPQKHKPADEMLFSVRGICSGNRVHDVTLAIRRGEIFGLAGLVGAGRTELGEAIAGIRRATGQILLDGKRQRIRTVSDAVAGGIAYLSEDRKGRGLTLPMSTIENIVMVSLARYSHGLLSAREQRMATSRYVDGLRIKLSDAREPVRSLSGGNQQKVALAKWLEVLPRFLILDEPTRGVDIGAKEEIYRLIKGLALEGRGILLISSEFNELIGLCHRIGVMREGRLVGVVDGAEATEEMLMHLSAGIASDDKIESI